MDVLIIFGGLGALIVLAVVIGLLTASEQSSVNNAWRKIAEARRRNWEDAQRNRAVIESLERCKYCPFRRGSR